MQSQKAVLKLDLNDDKEREKAMGIASGFAGAESIAVDMKDKQPIEVETTDPVELVEKLRKQFPTEIVSVGPAKEAQKKDDKKKNNPDKEKNDNKSNVDEQVEELVRAYKASNPSSPDYYYGIPYDGLRPPPLYNYGRYQSEDPISCVIC